MSIGYLIYQAERPKTATEQRRIDAANGRQAASSARLLHSAASDVRGRRPASDPQSGRPCPAARQTQPHSHPARSRGHAAGALAAGAGATDIVDARVVEGSVRRRDLVVSSDPDDLQSIASAAGRRLEIDDPCQTPATYYMKAEHARIRAAALGACRTPA
jgi:hypothetical protein